MSGVLDIHLRQGIKPVRHRIRDPAGPKRRKWTAVRPHRSGPRRPLLAQQRGTPGPGRAPRPPSPGAAGPLLPPATLVPARPRSTETSPPTPPPAESREDAELGLGSRGHRPGPRVGGSGRKPVWLPRDNPPPFPADLHPAVPTVPGPPSPARGATTPCSRRTPEPHLRLGDPVPPQLHHGEVALAQRALDVVEPHPDRPALQVPRAIRHDHAGPPLQDTATGARTSGPARSGAERAGGRRAARLGSGRRPRFSLQSCFPPAPQGPARRAPALTCADVRGPGQGAGAGLHRSPWLPQQRRRQWREGGAARGSGGHCASGRGAQLSLLRPRRGRGRGRRRLRPLPPAFQQKGKSEPWWAERRVHRAADPSRVGSTRVPRPPAALPAKNPSGSRQLR